jgi:hypothetical protein
LGGEQGIAISLNIRMAKRKSVRASTRLTQNQVREINVNCHPNATRPMELPDLELSYGQLLWAIHYGRDPDQMLKDRARYLRQMDIPAAAAREADGSGKRISYDFFDLIELGLAVTSLDLGFRPKEISAGLVGNRLQMRKQYADVWGEIPDLALQADWVRSRGRITPFFEEESFVRLHDRRSEKFGNIDFVSFEEANEKLPPFEPVERFENEPPRRLIPLKRVMIQWVAWAQEAPIMKPGPTGKES